MTRSGHSVGRLVPLVAVALTVIAGASVATPAWAQDVGEWEGNEPIAPSAVRDAAPENPSGLARIVGAVGGFRLPSLVAIGDIGDATRRGDTTAAAGLPVAPVVFRIRPIAIRESLDLAPSASRAQQVLTDGNRPTLDRVGGFQLNLFGAAQLVGSSSGQVGATLAYFRPTTAALGLELEGAATFGPSGRVYHGLLSVILQSGARSAKMAPYLAIGGGFYHAEIDLQAAVQEELEIFGIELGDEVERGPLLALGFGVRYYVSDHMAIRLDFREFRALTQTDGGFLDRLFALRRVGGMVSIEF